MPEGWNMGHWRLLYRSGAERNRMNHWLEQNIHENWKRVQTVICVIFCIPFLTLLRCTYYSPHYIIFLTDITNIYWGIINVWLCSGPWDKMGEQKKMSTLMKLPYLFLLFYYPNVTEALWKQGCWLCLSLLHSTLVT